MLDLKGLSTVQIPHPLALQTYSMEDWVKFRNGDLLLNDQYTKQIAYLNYWDRIIFYAYKLI